MRIARVGRYEKLREGLANLDLSHQTFGTGACASAYKASARDGYAHMTGMAERVYTRRADGLVVDVTATAQPESAARTSLERVFTQGAATVAPELADYLLDAAERWVRAAAR
ncbi:hypothetical protein AB0J38_06715 [Streptomyces sp. NPDC050095]|uniref:hypothetical protein n=1 Tax=unclassified Streptomyces TaxID=2593676 RepID=UPI0034270941